MTSITVRRRSIALMVVAASLLTGTSRSASSLPLDPDIPQTRNGAETTSIEKELKLGMAYFTGQGVPQDRQKAAYWYEKAAKAGDPVAELQMGYLYQTGIGVPRDSTAAIRWYQLAAAGGLTNAKVNLGVLYMWGSGVQKNEELAGKLFEEAAAKGNGLAACYRGDMYYFGTGIDQDKAAARKWFKAGTKLHDPQATFNLATFYFAGKDDIHKEAELLRESAKAGYVPAMLTLGRLLVGNPDMADSPQEAIGLLERSANAGTWRSSVVLAIMARDGKGRPQDSHAAYYHFKVAALQGGEQAERLVTNDLRILSAKMSAGQKTSVDAEAERWSQLHSVALQFVYNDGDNRKGIPAFAFAASSGGTHAVEFISPPPQ